MRNLLYGFLDHNTFSCDRGSGYSFPEDLPILLGGNKLTSDVNVMGVAYLRPDSRWFQML